MIWSLGACDVLYVNETAHRPDATPPVEEVRGRIDCAADPDHPLRVDCEVQLDTAASITVVAREVGGRGAEVRSDPTPVDGFHRVRLWGLAAEADWSIGLEGAAADPASWTTPRVVGPGAEAPLDRLSMRAATRPGDPEVPRTVWFDVSCSDDGTAGVWLQVDTWGRVTHFVHPGGQTSAFGAGDDGVLYGVVANEHLLGWDPATGIVRDDLFPDCDHGDGPCPHHAVGTVEGALWSATATMSVGVYEPWRLPDCPTESGFVLDALTWHDSGRVLSLASIGLSPDTVRPDQPSCNSAYWLGTLGTDTPIDVTHLNGISIVDDEALLSLAALNRLVRVDLGSEALTESIEGPLPIATSIVDHRSPNFEGQHDPHLLPDGSIQILDNLGEPSATRVLRIGADRTITSVWALVDDDRGTWTSPEPLKCPMKGSAIPLDNGTVLVGCKDAGVMVLDRPNGTTSDGPAWFLDLACGDVEIGGVFRALPGP